MTNLTLGQIRLLLVNIKKLVILKENKEITKINYSTLKEYENYNVVIIDTFMESVYSETFKTMTIQSGICLTLTKEVNA